MDTVAVALSTDMRSVALKLSEMSVFAITSLMFWWVRGDIDWPACLLSNTS